MLREGNLQQIYHMFRYLKLNQNARLVLDPTYPDMIHNEFDRRDWKEFYGDLSEPMPTNAPRLLGKELLIGSFVDAVFPTTQTPLDPALVSSSWQTCHLYIGCQKKKFYRDLIVWGKFCAMEQCCKYLKGLRYKL